MYKRHLNQTHLLDASESFGGIELDNENEWVKLAKLIPWHEFEEEYAIHFPSKKGQPAIGFRMALGTLLVKERYVDDTHFEMDRGIGPFSLFHIPNSRDAFGQNSQDGASRDSTVPGTKSGTGSGDIFRCLTLPSFLPERCSTGTSCTFAKMNQMC